MDNRLPCIRLVYLKIGQVFSFLVDNTFSARHFCILYKHVGEEMLFLFSSVNVKKVFVAYNGKRVDKFEMIQCISKSNNQGLCSK